MTKNDCQTQFSFTFFMCTYECMRAPWEAHGGQRASYKTWLSPSWVLSMKLRSLGLMASGFTHWAVSLAPEEICNLHMKLLQVKACEQLQQCLQCFYCCFILFLKGRVLLCSQPKLVLPQSPEYLDDRHAMCHRAPFGITFNTIKADSAENSKMVWHRMLEKMRAQLRETQDYKFWTLV